MSRDTFLSEVLYEAVKALEKFASVPEECACLQEGRWSNESHTYVLFIYCVILPSMSINSLHLCLRLLCRLPVLPTADGQK